VEAVAVDLTAKQARRLTLEFERGDICALAYYRRLRGLTVEQLAEQVGVESRVVYKLETKRVKFPKSLAKSIADVLMIETHQLFEGSHN
jgi:DNA-binding XRE family transcriptional regulator